LSHQRKTPVGKPYTLGFLEISVFLKNYINLGTYDDSKTWYGKCLKFIMYWYIRSILNHLGANLNDGGIEIQPLRKEKVSHEKEALGWIGNGIICVWNCSNSDCYSDRLGQFRVERLECGESK
jgi:hypothetical protein